MSYKHGKLTNIMFRRSLPTIVLSEPDIQAALTHLRSLPFRENAPISWDRQYVVNLIREAAGNAPKVDDCFQVGPGVYGLVKPFGVDLAGGHMRKVAFRYGSQFEPLELIRLK